MWQRAVTHSADHRALTPVIEPQGSDKSVAVLPFVDLSEKHDQEYFSDGLAEELLDLLSLVPDCVFRSKRPTIPSHRGQRPGVGGDCRRFLLPVHDELKI